MNERQLITEFSKLFTPENVVDTCVYEFKMVKGTFAFDSVKEHQIEGLLHAKKGMWHKISDSPWGTTDKFRFTFKKPFDGVWIKAREAYVVPIFYIPRKQKIAVMIPIEDFIKLKIKHSRKSIRLNELDEFTQVSY